MTGIVTRLTNPIRHLAIAAALLLGGPAAAEVVLDNTADGTSTRANGYSADASHFNAEMFTTPTGDDWIVTEQLFGAASIPAAPITLTLSLWATDAEPIPTGSPIISTSRSFELTTTRSYCT